MTVFGHKESITCSAGVRQAEEAGPGTPNELDCVQNLSRIPGVSDSVRLLKLDTEEPRRPTFTDSIQGYATLTHSWKQEEHSPSYFVMGLGATCKSYFARDSLTASDPRSEPRKRSQEQCSNCRTAPQNFEDSYIRLLDGEGVRGYSNLLLIKSLMERISQWEESASAQVDVEPADPFNASTGTSTGGLVASLLSRMRGLCSSISNEGSPISRPGRYNFNRLPPSQQGHLENVPSGNPSSHIDVSIESRDRWLLNCKEYRSWRDQFDGCFWLSGSPGTGKSRLTHAIADHLRSERCQGNYIVMYSVDVDNQAASHCALVLGELIMELLSQSRSEGSRRDLESAFMELVMYERTLSYSQITCILSRIKHNLGIHGKLTLLLDGLDEVGGETAEQHLILHLVEQLTRYEAHHHIKCFISSRMAMGHRTLHIPGNFQVDLDSHHLSQEVFELYVFEVARDWNISATKRDRENLAKTIVGKAKGGLLWARVVLEHIRALQNPRSAHPDLPRWLASIGAGDLSAVYGSILDVIQESSRTAALSMLRWVTYVARPLHAQELLGALHAETGLELQPADIEVACVGLLSIAKNGIVRLVHSTLRDYLRTRMGGNWEDVSDEANEIITHVCLKSLDPETFLESLGLYRKVSENPESRGLAQPFRSYASQFWIFHYRLAESSSSFLPGLLHDALEVSVKRIRSSQLQSPQSRRCLMFGLPDSVDTGLLVGCRYGLRDLVKLELDMGGNANFTSENQSISPLTLAVMAGCIDTVKLLLEYGASSQVLNESGSTPLSYAIASGRIEIVSYLVKNCSQPLEELTEPYLLNGTSTEICTLCSAVDTIYEVRRNAQKLSERRDATTLTDSKLSPSTVNANINDVPAYSPIIIHAETVASKEDHPHLSKTQQKVSIRPVRTSISIKWFSGDHMYKALRAAAKYGIEDVRWLLVAAGNDIQVLSPAVSVPSIFSEMRI